MCSGDLERSEVHQKGKAQEGEEEDVVEVGEIQEAKPQEDEDEEEEKKDLGKRLLSKGPLCVCGARLRTGQRRSLSLRSPLF